MARSINDEAGADRAIHIQQDVTDSARWVEVVDAAVARLGGLSVLVNNAGIAVTGSIESLPAAE
jgi:NAD(P)-dependent dehydrogenase (short-subunit alcohol dehydrogenase family)